MNHVPHRQELMAPLIQALKDLGGSGSIDEIREKVISNLGITDEAANTPHVTRRGPETRTELEYNLAWARTYLKQTGHIDNSSRGVWRLLHRAEEFPAETTLSSAPPELYEESEDIVIGWKEQLNSILTTVLSPSAFERLIQRVLRETGFVQVEVTGRSGDGGIDGKGIAKINGILSFHVVFQCKRYKGAVGAPEIRNFRGAVQGRADKGLFITTGYFSRDAIKEAVRDGAIAIDLVDGEKLAEKLKELSLGVEVELTERVHIIPEWFNEI